MRPTLKGSLLRGWYIEPTLPIVMRLFLLFLTQVTSGLALHATLTVTPLEVAASAGRGEAPHVETVAMRVKSMSTPTTKPTDTKDNDRTCVYLPATSAPPISQLTSPL